MKKNFFVSVVIVVICLTSLMSTCFAGAWSKYATTDLRHAGTGIYYGRGVKGDFKLPDINANKTNSGIGYYNFITFEQWIYVNDNSGDWLEIGYMDGSINHMQLGRTNYKGFYKAKEYNGTYWEVKLDKTASVGTTYTFTIVDVNHNGLWEIYIGSTYFGSFDGTIKRSTDLKIDQGYEFNIEPGSATPTRQTTYIKNQKWYFKDNSGNTWRDFSSASGSVSPYNNATNYITSVTFNSSQKQSDFIK